MAGVDAPPEPARDPVTGRDRDPTGRARNARPRDALGRPLPYDAAGEERAPEGVLRTPAESLAEAQRLLDAGRPFHAHEVLEDAWKSAPAGERAAVARSGPAGRRADPPAAGQRPRRADPAGAWRGQHRALRGRTAARHRRRRPRALGPHGGDAPRLSRS